MCVSSTPSHRSTSDKRSQRLRY
uniref:Uncharacterized protein n=1 Tax=Arundo donax TaxID=35708 RepID=A0A0A9BSW4_ARUDO